MNNNVFQTSETVKKGSFRIGVGIGGGLQLELGSILLTEDELGDTTYNQEEILHPFKSGSELFSMVQLDLGYGITNRLEIQVKGWTGVFGGGYRLGGKYRFTALRKAFQFAIMPGISFMNNEYKDSTESSSLFGDDFTIIPEKSVIGYELPFIFGYNFDRRIGLYFVPSYNFYKVNITKWLFDELERKYDITRIGLAIGLSLKPRHFFIRPEFVFNLLKGSNNSWLNIKTAGLGIGLEF